MKAENFEMWVDGFKHEVMFDVKVTHKVKGYFMQYSVPAKEFTVDLYSAMTLRYRCVYLVLEGYYALEVSIAHNGLKLFAAQFHDYDEVWGLIDGFDLKLYGKEAYAATQKTPTRP